MCFLYFPDDYVDSWPGNWDDAPLLSAIGAASYNETTGLLLFKGS